MFRFLVASLVLCLNHSLANAFTLEISEEDLQKKVDLAMPYEVKRPFFTVVLSEPVIDLSANDNRVHVATRILVVAPGGISKSGWVKLHGPLTYNISQGTFFLLDPIVEEVQVDKLQENLLPTIKGMAQSMAGYVFTKYPIYTLKEDAFKSSLAKHFLKNISIKNSRLLLDFEIF